MNRWAITLMTCLAMIVATTGCDSAQSKSGDTAVNGGSGSQAGQEPQPGAPISPDILAVFPDLPTPMHPAEPVQLKYKMQPGDQWQMVLDSDLNMNSMGMRVAETSEAEVEFTCKQVSDNQFQLASRITRLISAMDTPGGGYRIDTDNPDQSRAADVFKPVMEIWKSVLEIEADFEITTRGTFPEVRIPEGITRALASRPEANRFALTEETLFANFVLAFMEVPEGTLEVGQTWEPEIALAPQGASELSSTARFLGVTEMAGRRLAMIEIASRFGKPEDNEMFQKFDMRGDGVVLFDLDGGYIWKEFISRTGDFELIVNDASMEQTMSGKILLWRVEK